MEELLKLPSLEASLKKAEDFYRAQERVLAPTPMNISFDAWMKQAEERWTVMSHMNPVQLEVALETEAAENKPMLHATLDYLDGLINALKKGKGQTKTFIKKQKKAKKLADQRARQLSKE